jgi:AGZA family xanthine/uracil permease-like MFS transporter
MANFKNALDGYFGVSKSGSKFSTEILAGLTTFFAMAYIMFVNPMILGDAGMPTGAVFLATIFATVIGTLVMGLFANVPYAVAPGMGLNAFFTYTICIGMKFTWQQALAMVFICGIINILITVTKVRKHIVKAIPKSLQYAIGGGIGLFIAYIGFLNVALIQFKGTDYSVTTTILSNGIPFLVNFTQWEYLIPIIGLIVTVVLLLFKVRGSILLGIIFSTILCIITGVSDINSVSFSAAKWASDFNELGQTFGAAFGSQGMGSLFSDLSKLPVIILAIFAFSLTDTFDTVGTFVGTGRRSGIFNDEEIAALENSKGFKSKMDKALFADSIATSIGAIFGTSNTTTYIESSAGIEAGGKTGLVSVVTAACFFVCILLSPIVGLVASQATTPALIIVGIMMAGAFRHIDWEEFSEAIPAFLAAVTMALFYSISLGIAFGFIFYCIVKLCKGQFKEVHPILWGSAILFVLYFVFMALQELGVI